MLRSAGARRSRRPVVAVSVGERGPEGGGYREGVEDEQRSAGPRKDGPTVIQGALIGLMVGLVVGIVFIDELAVGIALGIILAVAGAVFVSARSGGPQR